MNTPRESVLLQYRRALARKRRGVDLTGLAVALAFLIAVSLWGLWRTGLTAQQVIAWSPATDVAATIELRPGVKSRLEEDTADPVHTLTGPAGTLHDPRQGR